MKSQQDPSLYHLPPHSLEAEEAIISAILHDNSTLMDIVEVLAADDFYRSAHQKIYATMLELFGKGEPVDLVTLTNALKARGAS